VVDLIDTKHQRKVMISDVRRAVWRCETSNISYMCVLLLQNLLVQCEVSGWSKLKGDKSEWRGGCSRW